MTGVAAIRARRLEISEALARLLAEDEELANAEQVLARLGGEALPDKDQPPLPATSLQAVRAAVPRSQREYVIDALANADAVWLRSSEIILLAKKRWGVTISERSLRPLLSVMKRDGQIVRQGRMLALPGRGQVLRISRRGSR